MSRRNWLEIAQRGNINTGTLAECTTKDGHKFTGEWEIEDGHVWMMVVGNDGLPYQVNPDVDEPIPPTLLTMTQFIGKWTEAEVKTYFQTQQLA